MEEMQVLERSIKYDGKTTVYACQELRRADKQLVLLHTVRQAFSMQLDEQLVCIPAGSLTIAYYWEDRPYNAYYWVDSQGRYLGTYFNLVKNTRFTEDTVTFHDLIIDVMVLPSGVHDILDVDELPIPLANFENGTVLKDLQQLVQSLDDIIAYMAVETGELAATHGLFQDP
ncbi:DUF402 domain-containing protein [Paenibacillaceae bacterium]|nr:DUF402 domain-containing protein [Paenibacillaceae bacterium]